MHQRINPHFNQGRLILHEPKESGIVNVLLVLIIILMVGMFSFVTLFSRGIVDGDSMLGTLHDKDSLLITRYSKKFDNGDIIILTAPDGTILVKRIMAVGGENFKFKKVLVNGGYTQEIIFVKIDNDGNEIIVDEPYILESMIPSSLSWQGHKLFSFDTVYTVPDGEFLYLGDNRNNSRDSRYYGFAKADDIIGKSVYIVKEGSSFMFLLNLFFPEPS